MIKIDTEQSRSETPFAFLPKHRALFQQAYEVHDEFERVNSTQMASHHDSEAMSYKLGDIDLTLVALGAYERQALDVSYKALEQLAGKNTSELLFVVETPLQMLIEGSEAAAPDRILRTIARDCSVELLIAETSLANPSIIEEAITLGKSRQIDALDILGYVVSGIAYPINSHTMIDIKYGVEVMRTRVKSDTSVLDLYQFAEQARFFDLTQIREIRDDIDRAAGCLGLTDYRGKRLDGTSYSKGQWAMILDFMPEKRAQILGCAVCWSSPRAFAPDIGRAISTCHAAWGDTFAPDRLHEGAIHMATPLTKALVDKDSDVLSYIRHLDQTIKDACFNKAREYIKEILERAERLPSIVIFADKFNTPAYFEILNTMLSTQPTDVKRW